MIGPVRHNPSTVVVLAGRTTEQVLAAVGRSLNVVLVRAEQPPPDSGTGTAAGLDAAAAALRRAAGITAAYVLVVADPLSAVATAWQAMWDVTAEPRGSDEFELRAAEALAAWRAKRFELPDYYLVVAPAQAGGTGADLYLGPLRAGRPQRVVVAGVGAGQDDGAGQAGGVLDALRSLPHGPWWPPLDELIEAARRFYAGGLAETQSA
jgi:hypothetical protein